MNTCATKPRRTAPGFTLIEVLIAILILALGVLGLGAVFPVVIAQQRDAVHTVDGEGIASMAESIVRSSSETIDFSTWFDPTSSFGKKDFADTYFTYEWVVMPFAPYNPNPPANLDHPGFLGGFDGSSDGFWYVDTNPAAVLTNPDDLNKVITVADRLFPQPYSGMDPKYVWDIVARRQPGTNRPQLGIFVRSIDARIRVPEDETLSSALTSNSGGVGYPLLPVAINKSNGKPAVDTGGDDFVYAAPQSLQVQVRQEHLDWLIFEDAANPFIDTSISFATKPGQLLLDNSGTVRTVLGPPENDADFPILRDPSARVVRVDPPFRLSQAVDSTGNLDMNANDPESVALELRQAKRASWVRQVVFTPRTPVAIRVVTLEEPTQ